MSVTLDRVAVRARVERLTRMATIPRVVVRVSNMIESRNASVAAIVGELETDQVLAAKVLRLINSAFYGFSSRVTSLERATVLLGLDVVKTLILSAAVLDMTARMNQLMTGLWDHSRAVAHAARLLAERRRLDKPEEVAISGLLHDLGKVVIAQQFPEACAAIRKRVAEANCLVLEAEYDVLGVGHHEIGAWLLERWALPVALVTPIRHHSDFHPNRDYADRTAAVHVADVLARALGLGNGGDNRVPPLHPDAWLALGLDVETLDRICSEMEADAGQRVSA